MVIRDPKTREIRDTEGLYTPTAKLYTERDLPRVDCGSRTAYLDQVGALTCYAQRTLL